MPRPLLRVEDRLTSASAPGGSRSDSFDVRGATRSSSAYRARTGAGNHAAAGLIRNPGDPDAGSIVLRGSDITALRPWEGSKAAASPARFQHRPSATFPISSPNVMVPLLAPRAQPRRRTVQEHRGKGDDAPRVSSSSRMRPRRPPRCRKAISQRLDVCARYLHRGRKICCLLDEPSAGCLTPAESELPRQVESAACTRAAASAAGIPKVRGC